MLLSGKLVTVYRLPPEGGRRGMARACAPASASDVPLDSPNEESAFKPPAISIERHTVGFATEELSGDNDAATRVWVIDVRDDTSQDMESVIGTDTKVGSLVVRSKGAVAWITCPGVPTGFASFGPTCLRPGERDAVMRFLPGQRRPQVLERSTRIDPQSLTRRGDRIRWRSGRKLRSAGLPNRAGPGLNLPVAP